MSSVVHHSRKPPTEEALPKEFGLCAEYPVHARVQEVEVDLTAFDIGAALQLPPLTPSRVALSGLELISVCERARSSIREERIAFEQVLSSTLSRSVDSLSKMNHAELGVFLDAELSAENLVETSVERTRKVLLEAQSQVVKPALREYQAATGFLDDHPKASALLCVGLAAASLAAGVWLAVVTHAAVHHGVHSVVHAISPPAIEGALFWVTYPVALFLEGIPVLGSSLLGPLAFGFFKSVGGAVAVKVSPLAAEGFKERVEVSAQVRDGLLCTLREMTDLYRVVAPQLAKFYTRNETVRCEVARRLQEARRRGDAVPGDLEALRDKARLLGAQEAFTLVAARNVERKAYQMSADEFRSPQLVFGRGLTSPSADHRKWGVVGEFASLSLGVVRAAMSGTESVATRTALNSADDLHERFEQMPKGLVRDPLSALGSGLSSSLHIALETGTKPEKALLDAVKGVVGMVKSTLVGGVPEGPSSETVLRVLFELDELEKGNKVRWFFKLIPSLAWALLKKPAIIMKAQRHEEAKGKISPKLLAGEMADSEGRIYSAWVTAKEITKMIVTGLSEAVHVWGVDAPLWALRRVEISVPGVGSLSEVARWLHTRIDKARDAALKLKSDALIAVIPGGHLLDQMSYTSFEHRALEMYLQYRYDPSSHFSQKEMAALLSYWGIRKAIAWRGNLSSAYSLYEEQVSVDRSMRDVFYSLHPAETFILTKISRAVESKIRRVAGPKREESRSRTHTTKQATSKYSFSSLSGVHLQRERPLIVDADPASGEVVLIDTDGTVGTLHYERDGDRIRAFFASQDRVAQVLPHADSARLLVVQALLDSTLEPFQQEVLLANHHALRLGKCSQKDAVESLCSAGIFNEENGNTAHSWIIESGILGGEMK